MSLRKTRYVRTYVRIYSICSINSIYSIIIQNYAAYTVYYAVYAAYAVYAMQVTKYQWAVQTTTACIMLLLQSIYVLLI